MNKILLSLILILLISNLVSCTSTSKAAQYPERYIDQPYTLPNKVDTWGIQAVVYYEKKREATNSFLYPIPVPLYWEHSFGDNLTLEIPLIPIGLRWKIMNDDTSELGLHFGWNLIYNTSTGTNIIPTTSLTYKKLKDKNHAYVITPSIEYSYYARETERSYINGNISFGYLTQLNETNALEPKLIVGLSGFNNRMYFPFEFFYTYRMNKVWQLESTYRYSQIGYDNYLNHSIVLMFKKFY